MHFCLFQPQIAGNVGNIIRTLSCTGIKDLDIIIPCGFIFKEKEFIRSVMDYNDSNVVNINKFNNFDEFLENRKNYRLALLTTKGNVDAYKYNYSQNTIIIAGNESNGLPDEIHQKINDKIIIQMTQGRSLNLAISIAMILAISKINI